MVLLCLGSKPCNTPSTRTLGSSQPAAGPIEQFGQRAHGRQHSEILCNRFKFIDRAPLYPCQRSGCLLEAVFDVVVISDFLAYAMAFSSACDCWATSRGGRCLSIIAMMLSR